MFIDDTHFLGSSLAGVTAEAASRASLSEGVGRIGHPDKLHFHGVRLVPGSMRLIAAHVDFLAKPSSRQPPGPLKIPLLHDLSMSPKIAKPMRLFQSVSAAALRRAHAPIWQVGALHAHALSTCDRVQSCVRVYTRYRGVYTCAWGTKVCTRVHRVQRCVDV